MQTRVSASTCVFCPFSLVLFSSVYLFCLSTLICLVFIYLILLCYYSLDACFLMRYKNRGGARWSRGNWKDSGEQKLSSEYTGEKINFQLKKASLCRI